MSACGFPRGPLSGPVGSLAAVALALYRKYRPAKFAEVVGQEHVTEPLSTALASGRMPTDEAQAIEWSGQRPRLVAGRADNIKVTTADDLALAGAILSTEKI